MHDIFLSYDHDDQGRIAGLVDALAPFGWKIWWDRNILPGQTWDEVLAEALEAARCVVVTWTRHSVLSDWVRIEANRARERGVLVPALLDEVQIPLAFQLVQAARLVDWDGRAGHAGFTALVSGIRALVDQGQPAASPPAVSAEERALDAAIGSRLRVHQPAHLITMIRRAESAGLKAILEAESEDARPEDVASRSFDLTFPRDAAGRPLPVNLALRVNSPEFDPPTQEKKVRIAPSRDSGVFDFLLTPRETGDLVIQLEVYEQDVCLASRVLHANGVEQMRGIAPSHAVVSMPLPVKVQPMKAAAAVGGTAAPFQLPRPAPVFAPDPPAPPAPKKRLLPWMKLGAVAAMAFLCVPAIYLSLQRPNAGQATLPSESPPVAPQVTSAHVTSEVLFRTRRAGALIEVNGATCRTPCALPIAAGRVRVVARRGNKVIVETVTIPALPQVTILVDEVAQQIRIREEKK